MTPRRDDETERPEPVELAALADGSLAPERRAALEERIAGSPELAALLAEQELGVTLTRRAAEEVEAPAALRAGIESRRRPERARTRRLAAVGAAAVVAATAVAVGFAVFDSGTSPQRFEVALASTELAPDASGKATLTKTQSGWEIELYANGLPRLDGGRFYQAWLRDPGGNLVAVGTFNEGEHVTLWAGVSPVEFTTLTVTRERADGDQASSGEKVLVGEIDTDG
jgi:hypothetical protein